MHDEIGPTKTAQVQEGAAQLIAFDSWVEDAKAWLSTQEVELAA